MATIQLHSHRYCIVPNYWSKTDQTCSDWWAQIIIDNGGCVCISGEILWQGMKKYNFRGCKCCSPPSYSRPYSWAKLSFQEGSQARFCKTRVFFTHGKI